MKHIAISHLLLTALALSALGEPPGEGGPKPVAGANAEKIHCDIRRWAGVWQTNWGVMKLRFDDGSFSGNYGPSQHAVSGRFDPKSPCVLRGIWRHTKSTATGRFTFRITAPKTFKGNWSSGEADPDVAGSSWTGTRLAAPVVALPKNISLSQLKLEQAKLRARLNSEYHKAYREKHLIGLAVTITRGCIYCTGGRIEKALDSGISQETLGALTDLVAAVNAGVVVRTVLQGLEGLSCDGPECA